MGIEVHRCVTDFPAPSFWCCSPLGSPGAGDEPGPDVAGSTSSTAAPTTSAPTSVAPITNATPEPEVETAEQFIRRWHQVGDDMQQTGDTRSYLALSPDCRACADTARLIAAYYEAGGYVEYSGTRVTRVKKLGSVGKALEFEVDRTSPPTRYKESAQGPIQALDGGKDKIRIKIAQANGRWFVLDVGLLSS